MDRILTHEALAGYCSTASRTELIDTVMLLGEALGTRIDDHQRDLDYQRMLMARITGLGASLAS